MLTTINVVVQFSIHIYGNTLRSIYTTDLDTSFSIHTSVRIHRWVLIILYAIKTIEQFPKHICTWTHLIYINVHNSSAVQHSIHIPC